MESPRASSCAEEGRSAGLASTPSGQLMRLFKGENFGKLVLAL